MEQNYNSKKEVMPGKKKQQEGEKIFAKKSSNGKENQKGRERERERESRKGEKKKMRKKGGGDGAIQTSDPDTKRVNLITVVSPDLAGP